jgi:hypothetical protein
MKGESERKLKFNILQGEILNIWRVSTKIVKIWRGLMKFPKNTNISIEKEKHMAFTLYYGVIIFYSHELQRIDIFLP